MPLCSKVGDTTIGWAGVNYLAGKITTGNIKARVTGINIACVGNEVRTNIGNILGIIDSGSPNARIENKPIARLNDTFSGLYHGHITSGTPNVRINGV